MTSTIDILPFLFLCPSPLPAMDPSPRTAPMTTPGAAPDDRGPLAPLYTALRILGLVVLVLMLLSILYSGWIAVQNWGAIRV